MSIWTKPIFGRAETQTPASPVALRCARIRAAATIDAFPAVFAGMMVGPALAMAGLFVAIWGVLVRGGASPSGVAQRIMVLGVPIGAVVMVVLVILFATLGPRTMRAAYDRTADLRTQEHYVKQRRSRRRYLWTLVGIATVVVLASVVLSFVVAWQAAVMPLAIVVGKYGGMTLAIGLRARRGNRTVCARCDYSMGSWRAAAAQCAECGNRWQEPWGARFGRRAVNFRLVLLGSALLGLCVLMAAGLIIWGLPKP